MRQWIEFAKLIFQKSKEKEEKVNYNSISHKKTMWRKMGTNNKKYEWIQSIRRNKYKQTTLQCWNPQGR